MRKRRLAWSYRSERGLWEAASPRRRWICFNAVGRGSSTLYVVAASGGQWVRISEERMGHAALVRRPNHLLRLATQLRIPQRVEGKVRSAEGWYLVARQVTSYESPSKDIRGWTSAQIA